MTQNQMTSPFEAIPYLKSTGESDPLRYYNHPVVGVIFRKRITMGLDLLDGHYGSLLEVGYGCGLLLPYWAGIADEVYGLDLDADPAEVKKCLNKFARHSYHLERGSLLDMPYEDETFDCTVAFSVLEHIAEVDEAVDELKRVTKPGGRILVGMPVVNKGMEYAFKAIGFKNIDHHHVTAPREFFAAASKKLKPLKRRALPLGLYHAFLFEKS